MKKGLVGLFLLLGGWTFGQASLGEIIGTVVDSVSNEPIYSARISVLDNGKNYMGYTDLDGRFRISGVPSGNYKVTVATVTDTLRGIPVDVAADGFGNTGVIKLGKMTEITEVIVSGVYSQLKLAINSTPVWTLTAKDIRKSPNKFSIQRLVAGMTSEVKQSENGDLMFKGSRSGDMLYLVDGIKTRSIGSLPSCAINNLMVYTGGLPAKYGDTMGGVVVLETKTYFDIIKERNGN